MVLIYGDLFNAYNRKRKKKHSSMRKTAAREILYRKNASDIRSCTSAGKKRSAETSGSSAKLETRRADVFSVTAESTSNYFCSFSPSLVTLQHQCQRTDSRMIV